MLVKINARGSGGGSGPTNYLMAEKDHAGKVRKVAPVVLSGSVELTRTLIDSLPFKRKYTSGTLCFSEQDLPLEKKQDIMREFERTLFPGLDQSNYSILWVEHRDKDRLELNFLIPNVELQTGKRLQPYYHKADLKRVNAWQGLTNHFSELTDPHDPKRSRAASFASDLPKQRSQAIQAITYRLLELGVESRLEVITELQNFGFEISRQTATSISIKVGDSNKPIRLKGELYGRDFKGVGEVETARSKRARGDGETHQDRIRLLSEEYQTGMEKRRKYLAERYQQIPEKTTVDFDTGFDDWVGQLEQFSVVRSAPQKVERPKPKPELEPDHHSRRSDVSSLQANSVTERHQRASVRVERKPDSALKIFVQKLQQMAAAALKKSMELKNYALRLSGIEEPTRNHNLSRPEPIGRVRLDRSTRVDQGLGFYDRSGNLLGADRKNPDPAPVQFEPDRDHDIHLSS
ncbi:relaxase/mobilization nuclease domain-containing protein [Porticoccaceae bacterium]|nr:relaxase/mobilization nuclease domain-containing protein [Porticoccaceae bacterium]